MRRQQAKRGCALALSGVSGLALLAPESEWGLVASAMLSLFALHAALALARRYGGARLSFYCGLVFGTAANAVALFSLVPLLMSFARLPLTVAGALALCAWLLQGLPYGLAALATRFASERGAPAWLALPSALTVCVAWWPALFPWQVGSTQLAFLPFVQVAELGGEALVSFFLLLFTAAGYRVAWARASGRDARAASWVCALALTVPTLYGSLRLPEVEAARANASILSVGVVQSNVGVAHKHDEPRARAILRELQRLTRALERVGTDLTVWGETAYPYPLLRTEQFAPRDERAPLAHGVRGPVLLGLESYAALDEAADRYNSAWLARADGSLGDRIDKVRLLPFGEYVPGWHWSATLRAKYRHPGFRSGAPDVLRTRWGALGVLICYEDLFSASARESARRGARVLLNLTNDAWFGQSRAPRLHELASRMRAIEQRRDLVRAVNTGSSSFTAASGRSILRTRTFERASFVAQVRLLDETTAYSRCGDWVPVFCALLWFGSCVRRRNLTAV